MATIGDDEIAVILEEQCEEIMAAKTVARDHDLAFNLQMQEALAASRVSHTSSPESLPGGDFDAATVSFTGGDAEFDFTSLILQDIARVDQERRDRKFGEQEMNRLKVDLDRWIYDQKFAKEIMNIPEGDWSKHGDNYQKPYAIGLSSSSSSLANVLGYPSKPIGLFIRRSIIFRSDSNGEDLEGYADEGLYDSVPMDEKDQVVLDYTTDPLITDQSFQKKILTDIARARDAIEKLYGTPQV